ncbi:unnamed protein product [Nesidiocoris tenuis]|uniref:AB hydrolase-1 domain-containing protein n=1 Tax=Nesidiocoris tenuis TaxID=355587 RepID=A0A6H5H3N0_9HEMI|nr:unnamed protein product [Nesidiocoris tenuis]
MKAKMSVQVVVKLKANLKRETVFAKMLRPVLLLRPFARAFHATPSLNLNPKNVEEVRIPVPWGHIAGKWWGPRGEELIVAVHGWQDNAGSWDPFLERLPGNRSVLAVDFPGQGLSSHLPPFAHYSFLEMPLVLKRVVNYLNKPVHLLGHSGGSAACFLFACTFPEDVLSYCGIDYLAYCYKKESNRVTHLAKAIDAHLNLSARDAKKAKRHSWEEAKERWVVSTKGSVTPASAEILMRRGVIKCPDGKVAFSRDNRLKNADLNLLHVEQLRSIVADFKVATCLLRGLQSEYFFERGVKHFPEVLDILKNQCRLYEYHEIDGNHHFHMDKAEEVVDLYESFLAKVGSRWWGPIDEQPLLALHGLFDNAASFDLLAAHLAEVPALLAVDLPGHGLSSHVGKGLSWSYTAMLSALRFAIKQHFKWPKAYLLGHSYGSTLALSYAGLFPAETAVMVNIDCARAVNAASCDDGPATIRRNGERMLAIENRAPSKKTMTYGEAVEKIFAKRKRKMTAEQCGILASRSLTNVGGGRYIFNDDLRMACPSIGRHTFHGYDALVENVRCSVLNIAASEGLLMGQNMAVVKKHLAIMGKNCQIVDSRVVVGGHHVHMDKPEEVAAAVDEFWRSSVKFRRDESSISSETYLVNHHFKWPHVDFLSHSFGSCSAFAYAGLFPKHVRKYVSLDCARLNMATRAEPNPTFLQIAVQSTLDAEEYENAPLPFEDHVANFMEIRRDKGGALTEKSSKILLARNLRQIESGEFVENVDPRLPMYTGLLPESTLDELARRITCELLSVRFTDGVLRGARKEAYEKQIDLMRKTSKNLIAVDIEGNHHAHLENPECVAPVINEMLT